MEMFIECACLRVSTEEDDAWASRERGARGAGTANCGCSSGEGLLSDPKGDVCRVRREPTVASGNDGNDEPLPLGELDNGFSPFVIGFTPPLVLFSVATGRSECTTEDFLDGSPKGTGTNAISKSQSFPLSIVLYFCFEAIRPKSTPQRCVVGKNHSNGKL